MLGQVIGKAGQPLNIDYTVNVVASADIEWETDEQPTGWSHGRDEPTYDTFEVARHGDILVSKVEFSDSVPFIINDDQELSLRQVQQYIDIATLSQLLNPETYKKALEPSFLRAIENLEPAEQEPRDW